MMAAPTAPTTATSDGSGSKCSEERSPDGCLTGDGWASGNDEGERPASGAGEME